MRWIALLFVLAPWAAGEIAIPPKARQILKVEVASWTSTRGTAQMLERTHPGKWKTRDASMPVMVGRNGVAWGLGLHSSPLTPSRLKREGDGCAPAGVFALGTSFGFMPRRSFPAIKLTYLKITPTIEAIDDPKSSFYNRIVDRRAVARPDWRTSERMAEIPEYVLGVVVRHNPGNRAGAGSCIFLHEWRGNRNGSAGCTLLRSADLRRVLAWLDPELQPVLLQLPAEELRKLTLLP